MSGSTGMAQAIQTQDFSLVVGGTAVIAIPAGRLTSGLLRVMRIYNVSTADTIWCSRAGTAGISTKGSFPILPGNFELWAYPQLIPANQLSIISTGTATPVTIEVG